MENKFMNMGENIGSMVGQRHDVNHIGSLKLCDSIYATMDNENVNKSACSALQQVRYITNFQSLSLPGSATLNIPNTDIVKDILISADVSFTLSANKALPQGYGYKLLDRIQVTINGSQTYTYDAQLLKNLMLLSLATRDKKSDYLALGGDRITSGSVGSFDLVLNVPAMTRVPDSNCKSLPLDCKMFNNISQVIVYWKDPAQVFSGIATNMTFTRGQFIVVNDVWTDSSLSLGNVLRADPSAQYLAPFQFIQTFSVPLNGDSVGTDVAAGNQVTKTISGFRYGNMTGILFAVEDPSLYDNGNPSVCAVEMVDFQIIFNGVQLYNAPGQTLKLIQANANTCLQTVQVDENTDTTLNKNPVNEPLYEAQFSLSDIAKNNSVVQQGLQIGNNSLQVSFKAKRLSSAALASSGTTEFGAQAVLKVGYVYDCALITSQGGARCDYVF